MKFGLPMAFTITMMSWSIVEYGKQMAASGELGHAMEAVKWGTDYLIKAHPEPNVLYGEVGLFPFLSCPLLFHTQYPSIFCSVLVYALPPSALSLSFFSIVKFILCYSDLIHMPPVVNPLYYYSLVSFICH